MTDFSTATSRKGRDRNRGQGGLLTSPFRALGRLMLWLSTANVDVLEENPSDRPKYIGMGSAVLLTSTMAGLAGGFALRMGLHLPTVSCVVLGILWGLGILGLDRWLVSTAGRGWGLVLLIPRLGLALLIGLVVSTPITLAIFRPEITAELPALHQQDEAGFLAAQASDGRAKKVKDLQDDITRQTTNLQVPPFNPANYPDVVSAKKDLDDANAALEADTKGLACETNGGTDCPGGTGGTGSQGYGPEAQQYRDKIDNYDKPAITRAQLAYDGGDGNGGALAAARAKYDTDKKTQIDAANKALTADRTQLKGLQDAIDKDTADFRAKNNSNDGLLIQLEALSKLSADRPTMRTAHWLLFGFFTVIECLPILVKFLMSIGRKNKYELALEKYDEDKLALSRSRSAESRAAQQLAGGSLLAQAQSERERRDDAIDHLTDVAIGYQTELAEQALGEWFSRQQERVGVDPEGFLDGRGEPLPPIVSPRVPGQQGNEDAVESNGQVLRRERAVSIESPTWALAVRRWFSRLFGGGERSYIDSHNAERNEDTRGYPGTARYAGEQDDPYADVHKRGSTMPDTNNYRGQRGHSGADDRRTANSYEDASDFRAGYGYRETNDFPASEADRDEVVLPRTRRLVNPLRDDEDVWPADD